MQQGAHENNCKEKPLKIKDWVRARPHVILSESLADFHFEVKLTVCCYVLSICILPASTGLLQCCIFSVCKCWSHRNSILYCLLYKQHRISLLFVLYLNGPTTVTVKHHFTLVWVIRKHHLAVCRFGLPVFPKLWWLHEILSFKSQHMWQISHTSVMLEKKWSGWMVTLCLLCPCSGLLLL